MFRIAFAGLWLLAIPVIAGAETRVDIDRAKNFAQYRTFTVEVQAPVRADGEVDEDNTIALNRQRQAIALQLTSRGLREVSADPDLTVRVSSREIERTELVSSGYPYGWYGPWGYGYGAYWGGPGYWGGNVWTYNYLQGDLTVDVIERSSGDLIYRAQVTRTLHEDDPDRDAMKFARKAFKKYPIELYD